MNQLVHSPGTERIDALLTAYLSQLETHLRGSLRSCYLTGSVTDGTADRISDVDGLVILTGQPSAEDQQNFKSVTSEWSARSNTTLDLVLLQDDVLFARGALPKKTASWVLIYGEEIRKHILPMSVEQYIDAIMRGSFICLKHPRGAPDLLEFPLTYPDPDGEFFGYELRGFREFDGWRSPGTKALVNAVSLAATTLVAMRTGFCATSRRESFDAYRARIGGRWAPLLDEIHARCRDAWSYRVPEDGEDRRQLRRFCHDVLAFENEYVLTCIRYLQLQLSDSAKAEAASAAETLAQLQFDPEALPPSA